ncbi:reverse transcriptase family protein [Anaerofustis stercorihominis]|uniref:reverse transcriptase family protein n=1 Tax=Anaerofustis stercorihominis TaxID=214853 RepID=UPI00210882BB|nr:reverse transcriptase family protein [Anaerofustis stercorihominis]MCQ4794236.1 reverse transcriptase family protein [Anaerofustis stercorihominis]
MEIQKSPLYKLSNKNYLKYLLKIPDKKFFKQSYITQLITPYIDNKNGKKRLIEVPDLELKKIQSRLKNILSLLQMPNYVFSGVKGRSYYDNAYLHKGNKYVCKIDLESFFPNISREKVYLFFLTYFKCSSDIAYILTNLTTVDLTRTKIKNNKKLEKFLEYKNIFCKNHLISGSPASQLLSYLVNKDMFDEIYNLANKNSINVSIYVDDIIFSSFNKISYDFIKQIKRIINKYNYNISNSKFKRYLNGYPKRITGVIIDKNGQLSIPNSLRLKIIKEFEYLKSHPNDSKSKIRLRGLILSSRQSEPNAFVGIYKYLKKF